MKRPSRPRLFPLPALAAGALTLALTLPGCWQKDPAELDAADGGSDVVAEAPTGEAAPASAGDPPMDFSEMTPEELRARAVTLDKEKRAKWDEMGRGYLASFQSRVYDPVRDGGLLTAEATATVRVGTAEATYAILYDADRKKNLRLSAKQLTRSEGIPQGTEKMVRRWAVHGLAGAYHTVVYYLPPIPLVAIGSNVAAAFIVHAPPYREDAGVSYSFDKRELVTKRGASLGSGAREITHFEWDAWRGRYVLQKLSIHDTDSDVVFDYSEHDGVLLLDHARYRKAGATFDVTFAYTRITRR